MKDECYLASAQRETHDVILNTAASTAFSFFYGKRSET